MDVGLLFRMTWLWSIFAGFYLVAYTFWVPHLFSGLALIVGPVALTLVLGLALLYDGFAAALVLQGAPPIRPLPSKRLFRLAGGIVLLAYVLVYLPPQGRIVAHWPLDLAITVLSGVVELAYGLLDL